MAKKKKKSDINDGVAKRLKKRMARNLLANKPFVMASPGIEAIRANFRSGRMESRNLILVGPGPTAAASLRLLRRMCTSPDFFVVTLNRSAAFLPEADAVFLVTTSHAANEHMEYEKAATQILISVAWANPNIVKTWPGAYCFYYNVGPPGGAEPSVGHLQHLNMPARGFLPAAGVVSAQAMLFGRYVGFDGIYCFGFDFCFHDGMRDCYGNPEPEDAETVRGGDGQEFRTNSALKTALRAWVMAWEYRSADLKQVPIYNVTDKPAIWSPATRTEDFVKALF